MHQILVGILEETVFPAAEICRTDVIYQKCFT